MGEQDPGGWVNDGSAPNIRASSTQHPAPSSKAPTMITGSRIAQHPQHSKHATAPNTHCSSPAPAFAPTAQHPPHAADPPSAPLMSSGGKLHLEAAPLIWRFRMSYTTAASSALSKVPSHLSDTRTSEGWGGSGRAAARAAGHAAPHACSHRTNRSTLGSVPSRRRHKLTLARRCAGCESPLRSSPTGACALRCRLPSWPRAAAAGARRR